MVLCITLLSLSFKYFLRISFNFCLVAAAIFLISVDVLFEGLMLDGCLIVCWVLVLMDESSWLKVMEGLYGE